jgi:hypothetical protein
MEKFMPEMQPADCPHHDFRGWSGKGRDCLDQLFGGKALGGFYICLWAEGIGVSETAAN